MNLQVAFFDQRIPYTGSELRPHYLLEKLKLKGTAIAAFLGPCEVPTENLVDWEDRLENSMIRSKLMVHFIGEFFGPSLREIVFFQRLFAQKVGEILRNQTTQEIAQEIRVDGDDVFVGDAKASVSIVTSSSVSRLFHFGINVDFEGAPVRAIGLQDIRVDPERFARDVLAIAQKEWESIEWACAKVMPV